MNNTNPAPRKRQRGLSLGGIVKAIAFRVFGDPSPPKNNSPPKHNNRPKTTRKRRRTPPVEVRSTL